MSSSYDHEALWLKSKLFLNWALEDGEHRTFDERALWASMALELLAKAALSKVSPLLIATPTEEGANILIAAGLISGDARFESIKASTLFKRCARAYKPFNDTHALAIAQARNNFLHGGEAAFTKMPPEAWWPRYWTLAIILVHAHGPRHRRSSGADPGAGRRTSPCYQRQERRAPDGDVDRPGAPTPCSVRGRHLHCDPSGRLEQDGPWRGPGV
jgi:hypothetical protein